MSLPVIVDISIGLVFIYLLLSLLASEIQELIATILQWRARHLKDSIANLFAGDVQSSHSVRKANKLTKQLYQHPLLRGVNQESKGFLPNLFRGITWILSRIYQKIVGKKEGEFGDRRTAPSYIPREAFATALLEQLGTKYFVERIVEAKFSEFVALILEKVGVDGESQNQIDCKKLQEDLYRIEEEFIKDRINLESSVNSVKSKLDSFISNVESKIKDDNLGELTDWKKDKDKKNALEELQDWKSRFFVEKLDAGKNNLEQVIINAGLKPTLQEIVDSIDKDSKTYRTYKKRFERYEQERFEDVCKDLQYFERFLYGFLDSILNLGNRESKKIFFENEQAEKNGFAGLVFENISQSYNERDSTPQIKRNKTPMSQIENEILKGLDNRNVENKLNLNKLNLKVKKQNLLDVSAFREGFIGKNNVQNWRDLSLFKEVIFVKVIPFCLLFILGLLISIGLSDLAVPDNLPNIVNWQQKRDGFRNLLIGPWGSLITITCLGLVPFFWFLISRDHFSRLHLQKNVSGKTLPEIFDDYSVDEIANDSKVLAKEFSNDIGKRLRKLQDRKLQAFRYREVKDLGRSFRRYYLRLLLENADIDLPFIPSSIKQSLAVLIRRSKISARQAEDQILQLKAEVEAWFDRSMERASGVYRRNAKGISILIGISLAIVVNANSIHILDKLAFDEELRQTISSSVQKSIEKAEDPKQEEFLNSLEQSLDTINLPIGWSPNLINEEFSCNIQKSSKENSKNSSLKWYELFEGCIFDKKKPTNEFPFFYPTAIASIFLKRPLVSLRYLIGWIITGIAISMGASFWFDLLGKLVKVRNTGKPISPISETSFRNKTSTEKSIKNQ